jgi:Trypsin
MSLWAVWNCKHCANVPPDNATVTAIGHGLMTQGFGSLSESLQQVNLTVVNVVRGVAAAYAQQPNFALSVTANLRATGFASNATTSPLSVSQSACQGDSGGPLWYQTPPLLSLPSTPNHTTDTSAKRWSGSERLDSQPLLVGITSFASPRRCDDRLRPNDFTRICTYTDWIWFHLCQHSRQAPLSNACRSYTTLRNVNVDDDFTNRCVRDSHQYQRFGLRQWKGWRIHGTVFGRCVSICATRWTESWLKRGWRCGQCPA